MLTVLIKRLAFGVELPVKATPESACFDLKVLSAERDPQGWTVRTGLSVALPPGHVMLIFPRSGVSTKYGYTLRNTIGVIDSDYRGEILLKLHRGASQLGDFDTLPAPLLPGSRIAQAMIIQLPEVTLTEVLELPESIRGTGGFGSTGT